MGSVLGWSSGDEALRRRAVLLDAGWAMALAAVLLPATVRTIWGSSWPAALEGVVLAAVLAGHGVVAVRRSASRLAFAVVGVLVLVLVLAPALDPGGVDRDVPFSAVLVPSVLVFPVVLYSVAAWCPDRTALLALALSSGGAAVVVVRLWGSDYLTVAQPGVTASDDPLRSWPLFLLLGVVSMVAVPWWAGRHRRLRMLYVAELERAARREEAERVAQARQAVVEERRRIAREMHDVVAHSLSVLVTQAEGGRLMAAKDPAVAGRALDTIARTGRDAMQSMASVLQVLDDPQAGHDTVEQPQPGLARLPALIEEVRRSGLPVRFEEQGGPQRLSGAAELVVYRMVQEALTNVLKHAGPEAATEVRLAWEGEELRVSVDNHKGRQPVTAGSGLGLRSMADRLASIGGSLRVSDAAGRFRVEACIPVAEARLA